VTDDESKKAVRDWTAVDAFARNQPTTAGDYLNTIGAAIELDSLIDTILLRAYAGDGGFQLWSGPEMTAQHNWYAGREWVNRKPWQFFTWDAERSMESPDFNLFAAANKSTLFEKLNEIEQPEKLHAWLVTTTRRKTLHAISKALVRRQSDLNTDEDSHLASSIADETPLPDEQLLILEEQHRIRTALASLDERCRLLLEILFHRDEPPSYAEIASALGIPEGSVGPTRARCLAKLLRLLKK